MQFHPEVNSLTLLSSMTSWQDRHLPFLGPDGVDRCSFP